MNDAWQQLQWAVKRVAQMQGHGLDGLRLRAALEAMQPNPEPRAALGELASRMGFAPAQWLPLPDPARLPLVAHHPEQGWGVVIRQTPTGEWVFLGGEQVSMLSNEDMSQASAVLSTQVADVAFGPWRWLSGSTGASSLSNTSFMAVVLRTLGQYRTVIVEACLASLFIGLLALATSLFSMQVYDRVIPTRGEHTLVIMASGVLLVIVLELAMKFLRGKVMDHIIVGLDNRLSRDVFTRLLSLRVDRLPTSVGSLAGQVRGYEQVRSFYTASTLFTLIDLPLALVFVVLIVFIGHPVVAMVPLVFAGIALYLGLSIRAKISQQAMAGAQYSNQKTGLLVETVEGIETIKAGAGGWKFLSRWITANDTIVNNDIKTRHLTDSVGYLSASLQQISYAGVVVAGAWAVMNGHMTMGALIACSIMSGRVLAPIMALPGLLVQHSHARAAVEGLEKIYEIARDHDGTEQPLTPETLNGHFQLENAVFAYGNNPPALSIESLSIRPGERVILLGHIGSGKSTLLRLLSGLYQPVTGRVLVDGLDMAHVHRQVLSDHIGYLQQDHRLFQGTLRDNLLVGLPDPGDEALIQAMKRTGMDTFVAAHPAGLQRAISEGGKGLSGGQKQLLAFTRIVLTQPRVWLLDEPTATMDEEQERLCLKLLMEEADAGKTMVIATHKKHLLALATRIVVVAGSKIVMDSPRDEVLQQIKDRAQTPSPQHVPTA